MKFVGTLLLGGILKALIKRLILNTYVLLKIILKITKRVLILIYKKILISN